MGGTQADSTQGWSDEAIRARLQALVEEHTQAEVARRAETSRNNVNRYVHGGKIPAEFCGALAANLGVNPAWLIAGEGTSSLSDVTASVGTAASDVLSLVQAMQSVTKLRLGALVGKEYAKVLRQLNEALDNYENLRGKLNAYSSTQLRQLVRDIQTALEKNDLEGAKRIRRAAEQVSRLCDESRLLGGFDSALGNLELFSGNVELSVKFHRKAFIRRLFEREALEENDLLHAANYLRSLATMFRAKEAQQVCRATLLLASNLRNTQMYWRLVMDDGLADMTLGHIRKGMRKLNDAYNRLGEQLKERERGHIITCDLARGTLPASDALDMVANPGDSAIRQGRAYYVANMVARLPGLEPEREIRLRACELTTRWGHAHPQVPLEATWLQALPKIYERKDSKVAEQFVEAHVDAVPAAQCLHVFRAHSIASQLFRLCDEEKRAKEYLVSADKALRRAPAEQTPSFLGLAVHYENALRLLPGGAPSLTERILRRRARKYFFKLLARGYGCFEKIVVLEKADEAKC